MIKGSKSSPHIEIQGSCRSGKGEDVEERRALLKYSARRKKLVTKLKDAWSDVGGDGWYRAEEWVQ